MAPKVIFTNGCAVAAEHPLASQAGSDAMKAGGNAFDAAVATSFALSVVLPHLNGLGGDFFALYFDGEAGEVRCLNGSGWAPSGLTVEAVRASGLTEMPLLGPGSVVVPGMVGGVHELHRSRGRTSFGTLLEPAVALAEGGFPASPGLERAFNRYRDDLAPEARLVYGGPEPGRRKPEEAVRQPALGARLREIARGGPGAFYQGAAGREIAETLEAGGVSVGDDDLEFAPEWVQPLRAEYRGQTLHEVPPNSMGATALLILKMLERGEPPPPNSMDRIVTLTEATKAALEARDATLGDPRFAKFDLERFLNSALGGGRVGAVSDGDTTYFSVADERGNLLSCIQSLFHVFGSRVYLTGSGFFLNNRASAFKLDGPNRLEPRKRPLHTLSALLISRRGEERPYMAVGTSGGEFRPQLHALFASNVVDYGMGVEEAIAYPRFVWDGKETVVEEGYKVSGAMDGLRVVAYPGRQGVAQGIEVLPSGKKAVCDVRGDGEPVGF